jgi:hypothetical protein
MNKIIITALAASILVTTVGCRSFTSPARYRSLNDGEAYFVDYDITRRGAFIVPKGKEVRTISEPAPDAGMESVSKFLASIDYKGIKGEASAEVAEKLIQFGQRTQTIMFLRETLFRLTEVGNNAGLDKVEYQELYKQVVQAAADLAKTEVEVAKKEAAKAETKKAEAETEKAKAVTEKIHKFETLNKSDPELFRKLLPLDK